MKMKKKTAMLLSFALGSTLFVTTAFAEVATKSGYDQLKDALKYTSKSFSSTLTSYTVDMSYSLKDNGKIISSGNDIEKADASKGATEHTSITSDDTDGTREYYSYTDNNCYIYHNSKDDTYTINEFANQNNRVVFSDPFQEKGASDIEKIVDALVGNLKDYVVVTDVQDGGKELTGTLKETQVPALVNAVVSFAFKRQSSNNQNYYGSVQPFPSLTKDIFVKEASGKMVVDKDGLIKTVLATGALSGKDDKDNEHNLTLEVLVKVTDVNNTVVNKPDLTGKKVVKETSAPNQPTFTADAYVGRFTNNIILKKDGKFIKIGERVLEIQKMDKDTVSGSYRENLKEGFEEYATVKEAISFTGKTLDSKDFYGFHFTLSDGTNNIGNIDVSLEQPNVYFNLNSYSNINRSLVYDSQFFRVFE